MACSLGYDCPEGPDGACCGEWGNEPIDPAEAAFVVAFMERVTGLPFGDMIGLKNKEMILAAAQTTSAD